MERKTHSLKFLRQRKFYTVLPVLALPFITIMFWALGGGQGTTAISTSQKQGFNVKLPDAYLKENKDLDKMSYYNKAQEDSAKLLQFLKNDPYYLMNHNEETISQDSGTKLSADRSNDRANLYIRENRKNRDPNEIRVNQKLQQLNAKLDDALITTEPKPLQNLVYPSDTSANNREIERLEKLMLSVGQTDYLEDSYEEDPEIQQLNGMLEKILDIQHPDRVQEKLKQASKEKKSQVFQVSPLLVNPVSLIDNSPTQMLRTDSTVASTTTFSSNGFYSLASKTELDAPLNIIQAVAHETQIVVDGSRLKMRLLNDIYINGIKIPKNNFIYGIASLNGERLQINISNILHNSHLLPVSLTVYDLDGISGIYIPGAIERDVGKQSADRLVQSLNMNTSDNSLGTQVASAGIEAAKSIFSKKVKLIKVTVKAGYKVFLRDEYQLQDL